MGWKKMFIGEKMPDKDDPQYRQRYETEVKAGRKFAKTMKIDVLAAKVQQFANDHKRLFLYLVFGFIIFSFGLNIYRMVVVYSHQQRIERRTSILTRDLVTAGHLKRVPRTDNNPHGLLITNWRTLLNKDIEQKTKLTY